MSISSFVKLRLSILEYGLLDTFQPLLPSSYEIMLLAKRNKRIKQLEREFRLQEIDEEREYKRQIREEKDMILVNELTNLFQKLNEVITDGN